MGIQNTHLVAIITQYTAYTLFVFVWLYYIINLVLFFKGLQINVDDSVENHEDAISDHDSFLGEWSMNIF